MAQALDDRPQVATVAPRTVSELAARLLEPGLSLRARQSVGLREPGCSSFLPIVGGPVLGCIEADFCE